MGDVPVHFGIGSAVLYDLSQEWSCWHESRHIQSCPWCVHPGFALNMERKAPRWKLTARSPNIATDYFEKWLKAISFYFIKDVCRRTTMNIHELHSVIHVNSIRTAHFVNHMRTNESTVTFLSICTTTISRLYFLAWSKASRPQELPWFRLSGPAQAYRTRLRSKTIASCKLVKCVRCAQKYDTYRSTGLSYTKNWVSSGNKYITMENKGCPEDPNAGISPVVSECPQSKATETEVKRSGLC